MSDSTKEILSFTDIEHLSVLDMMIGETVTINQKTLDTWRSSLSRNFCFTRVKLDHDRYAVIRRSDKMSRESAITCMVCYHIYGEKILIGDRIFRKSDMFKTKALRSHVAKAIEEGYITMGADKIVRLTGKWMFPLRLTVPVTRVDQIRSILEDGSRH